jgi:hypothetical protein
MKAELPEDSRKSGDSTGTSTPNTTSIVGSSTVALDENTEENSDETLEPTGSETLSTSSAKKGEQKAQDAKEDSGSSSKKHSNAENLVGKINNLVTTDLNNITEGRHFLLVGKLYSLQADVCFVTRTFLQDCTPHSRSSCASGSCTGSSAGGWYSLQTAVSLGLKLFPKRIRRSGCYGHSVPSPWVRCQDDPVRAEGEDEQGRLRFHLSVDMMLITTTDRCTCTNCH